MSSAPPQDFTPSNGHRIEHLASVFDRIMTQRDWQAPIHAVIPADQRAIVAMAVIHFTGTVPVFAPLPGAEDRLTVTAAGYRRGIGANHPALETSPAGGAE